MSKVEIEISDDRWFRGGLDFRPLDKQLCVAMRCRNPLPAICFYAKENDQFVIADSVKKGYSQIDNCQTLSCEIVDWNLVEWWKPLGLPADVEERVLAEVEKWFEEDER